MNDLAANLQEGFRIAKKTIKDYVDDAFWLFGLNCVLAGALFAAAIVIMAGTALGLLPVIVLAVAALIALVYAAPVIVGLYYAAYIVAQERAVKWHLITPAIKRYWRHGFAYLTGNLIFAAVMWNSLQFYSDSPFAAIATGLWFFVMFFWLALQFYYLPVLFERDDLSLGQALRSSLIIVASNWGITLVLVILWVIVVLTISFFFVPGIFLMLSVAALAGSEVVVYVARKEQRRREEDDAIGGAGSTSQR